MKNFSKLLVVALAVAVIAAMFAMNRIVTVIGCQGSPVIWALRR